MSLFAAEIALRNISEQLVDKFLLKVRKFPANLVREHPMELSDVRVVTNMAPSGD
jgi:hypothetical protein